MKILFLTQIVPYPPDAGPKVKTWHVLRHLADSGHELILACFVRPEEQQYLSVIKEICHKVYPIPMRRSRLIDLAFLGKSILKRSSFLVERDNYTSMQSIVTQIVSELQPDVIHADQFTMAQFALNLSRPAGRVFDEHNATWKLVERSSETARPILRQALRYEANRVKEYERKIIRTFDQTLTVTPQDRDFLLDLFPAQEKPQIRERMTTIPIAVDCDRLRPIDRLPESHRIVTLGSLHYPPNADGIRWFLFDVFPYILQAVPDAHLSIIGKRPPEDFLQEAQRIPRNLSVPGYVPDLEPSLRQAAMVVVPVRSGGGMRVRILEACAQAMPVVTTTIGLEGIEAKPGVDVLVEDEPRPFADAVIQLLNDPQRQQQLSHNGRLMVEQKYNWRKALLVLDDLYARLKLKTQTDI